MSEPSVPELPVEVPTVFRNAIGSIVGVRRPAARALAALEDDIAVLFERGV